MIDQLSGADAAAGGVTLCDLSYPLNTPQTRRIMICVQMIGIDRLAECSSERNNDAISCGAHSRRMQ